MSEVVDCAEPDDGKRRWSDETIELMRQFAIDCEKRKALMREDLSLVHSSMDIAHKALLRAMRRCGSDVDSGGRQC